MARVRNPARLTRAARITLLQVVVLVVLILLLGGLAIPLVGMMRKKAEVSGCTANLGQMVQAYNTHIGNRKQSLPSTQQARRTWAQVLKSDSGLPDKTYICPLVLESAPDYGSVSDSWSKVMDLPQGKVRVISSYGLNGWLLQPDRQVLRWSGGSAEQFFTDPPSSDLDRIPVFGDAMWMDGWPHADDQTPPNLRDGDRANQDGAVERYHMLGRFVLNRHNNAINVAFLDGHVETVELKNLKRLMWHKGFVVGDWQPPLPAE